MREILFRGKTESSEWVEGYYVSHQRIAHYIIPVVHGGYEAADGSFYAAKWHGVDPATVGQFTGLKDKNGKRIFEGDILRWVGPDDESGEVWVEFCGGVFALQSVECPCADPDLFSDFEIGDQTLEIIGNIHDHPDFLEED